MWLETGQPMNTDGLDDYRVGVFWLLCGAGFAVMGLAGIDWLGIQSWYLYMLGVGLFIVAVIVMPRRTTPDLLQRGWLPIIIAPILSAIIAVLSDEVRFGAIFPLVAGLLWIGNGLWLMLRPGPKSGG